MSWSADRKRLEQDLLCEKLRGRVQYFFTHYHAAPDQYGRFAVRVDGQEVLRANPYQEVYYSLSADQIKEAASIPAREWTKRGYLHEEENQAAEEAGRNAALQAGHIDSYDMPHAIHTYLNQPVEQSLWSADPLVRLFAVLDRRVGRRTLQKVRDAYPDQPEWLRRFYRLRLDAEGIALPLE